MTLLYPLNHLHPPKTKCTPPEQAVHPPKRFSIKTRYLFQKQQAALWAVCCFWKRSGEIRIRIERPGGAFIDRCKHRSIPQPASSPARRRQQNLSISARKKHAKACFFQRYKSTVWICEMRFARNIRLRRVICLRAWMDS